MNIIRLDSVLTERLRSGYSISTISQCVNELVFNALDANPVNIAIRLNLVSFRIEVSDDGNGIDEENLKNVGKRHYTSKCHRLEDLNSIRHEFGYRGESLASISTNCSMIKITSRFRSSNDSNTSSNRKTFRKTITGNEVNISEHTFRPSFGTTVTVIDFMNGFPVRRKCTTTIEFSRIKSFLEELHILHPNIAFKLIDSSTKETIFETFHKDYPEEVLADSLHNVTKSDIKFCKIRCLTKTSIKGLLLSKPSENNKCQLLFVNKKPIVHNALRDYINEILLKNKFCLTKKEKRHPKYVYIFNISCPLSQYTVSGNEVEFKEIKSIMKALTYLLMKFIKNEGVLQTVAEQKTVTVKKMLRLSNFEGAYKATASPNVELLTTDDSSDVSVLDIRINYHYDNLAKKQKILAMDTFTSVTSESEDALTANTVAHDNYVTKAIKTSKLIEPTIEDKCLDGKKYIMRKYFSGEEGYQNVPIALVSNEFNPFNITCIDDNFDSLVAVLERNHKANWKHAVETPI